MIKLKSKIKYNFGMTLIELIVVIAIFFIVSAITIFDYNSFKSSISLRNLADNISLSVRKTQGYAIGAKIVGEAFSQGYGLHFSLNEHSQSDKNEASNRSFIIFADKNSDGSYDVSGNTDCNLSGDECLELLTIKTQDEITGIYVGDNLSEDKDELNIVFYRPNPEARFYSDGNEIFSQKVGVEITNIQTKKTKKVFISNAGQINVE